MRGSSDPRHVHVHEPPADGFSHQAPFYADEDSFLAGTVPFVQEAAEHAKGTTVRVHSPIGTAGA